MNRKNSCTFFKDVKQKKQTTLKLVNLYNNPLIGTYVRKENGLHSVIYIIRKLDSSEVGVYGSKSLGC